MSIAEHYGNMLNRNTKNLRQKALTRLIENYPSHGYVIDKNEADFIFHRVRYSDENEENMRTNLREELTFGASYVGPPSIMFLSD
ncbi:MAG: hypothetical protein WB554_15225 [Desulfomonilaceae bacterium]